MDDGGYDCIDVCLELRLYLIGPRTYLNSCNLHDLLLFEVFETFLNLVELFALLTNLRTSVSNLPHPQRLELLVRNLRRI